MNNIKVIALEADASIDVDQLQRSSGVRRVTADEVVQHFYHPSAIVPTDDWRPIPEEIFFPNAKDEYCVHNSIGLFNAGDEIREVLNKFLHDYRKVPPNVLTCGKEIESIRDIIKSYLLERFSHEDELKDFNGIGFNSPRLETVTVDRKVGEFIGLHIDSWYGISLKSRLEDRSRICFNLGPVPRWFLFVPISIQDIYVEIENHGIDHGGAKEGLWDVQELLRRLNPSIHCLKLNPGQGYIAATEALIHDATTRWAERTSFNFQLMGKINWIAK